MKLYEKVPAVKLGTSILFPDGRRPHGPADWL